MHSTELKRMHETLIRCMHEKLNDYAGETLLLNRLQQRIFELLKSTHTYFIFRHMA
jgi:hypothetical protein